MHFTFVKIEKQFVHSNLLLTFEMQEQRGSNATLNYFLSGELVVVFLFASHMTLPGGVGRPKGSKDNHVVLAAPNRA